jgi:hypothetical protein
MFHTTAKNAKMVFAIPAPGDCRKIVTEIVISVFRRYVIRLPPLVHLTGSGKRRFSRDEFRDTLTKIDETVFAAGKYGIVCLLNSKLSVGGGGGGGN